MLNIINTYSKKDGFGNYSLQASNINNNKIILNNKTNNEAQSSKNNYLNNILEVKEKIENNEFIINEKNQEIELNTFIIFDEKDSQTKSLNIKIKNYYNNKNNILIEIIDNKEPLFYYSLKIDEIDYSKLKKEQNLFLEMKNFSDFFFKMLNNCTKENFRCILIIDKTDNANLIIEEKTQYKKLNHLSLKLKPQNYDDLKKYFNKIINDYKEKYEKVSTSLKEITENFETLKNEKNMKELELEKIKNENNEKINNLLNKNEKEINILKEDHKRQLEILDKDKEEIINKLKEENNNLKLNIDELNKDKSNLCNENFNFKKLYQDLKENYNSLNIEIKEKDKEIRDIKCINEDLNNKKIKF